MPKSLVQKSTMDLNLLKTEPKKYIFPWGPIKKIHEIGPYAVVEVHTYTPEEDQKSFYSYTNGTPLDGYTDTLERALLRCMSPSSDRSARVIAAAILLEV